MKNKIILFLIVVGISCKDNSSEETTSETKLIPTISYQIMGSYPHDETLFTEGLFVNNGLLYESTGSPANLPFTESLIGVLDTTSGKMDIKVRLDKSKYFGEGSTILNSKLYQLTYTSQTCFVYDSKTFKLINTFKFSNKEGWGLTNDGTYLLMSDGSYKITVVNPSDFSKVKEINVSENGYGIENINELEFHNGFIYANIWQKNEIIKIDATNGNVVGKIDFTNLFNEMRQVNPAIDVMNGIAYAAARDEFLLTGKLWSKVYRVKMN